MYNISFEKLQVSVVIGLKYLILKMPFKAAKICVFTKLSLTLALSDFDDQTYRFNARVLLEKKNSFALKRLLLLHRDVEENVYSK